MSVVRKLVVCGWVFAASVLSLHGAQATTIPSELLTGDMAPFDVNPPAVETDDILFTDLQGNVKTIDDYRGEILVVNLWATWCAPCRKEMPDLNNLQVTYGPKGVRVLALNEDRTNQERALAFLEEIAATDLEFFRDKRRSAMNAFGVRGLPATFVFDREGTLVGRLMGPAKWDGPYALAILDHMLAQD